MSKMSLFAMNAGKEKYHIYNYFDNEKMKILYKALVTFAIIISISLFAWVVVNMIGDIPPYDDWPGNHVEELKKIPHVEAFYNNYGDDVLIWKESGIFYQLGFQATADEKYSQLVVTFFGGNPFSATYSCTAHTEGNYEGIIRITYAKSSEITNCFT